MRNIKVTVDGEDLSGENPVVLNREDTEVIWTFVDPLDREIPPDRGLRVEFVACLPADNHFPTARVSPFTAPTLSSGFTAIPDSNAPFGLYIYVVRDAQNRLLKWSDRVFFVGPYEAKFGTVVPAMGPPNTSTRTNANP